MYLLFFREYIPVKQRRAALQAGRALQTTTGATPPSPPSRQNVAPPVATIAEAPPTRPQESLLRSTAVAQRNQPQKTAAEKVAQEEEELMATMLKKQALRSVQENAKGIVFTEPIKTGWTPPSWCEAFTTRA
jgi:ATP-dependent RNA helicase DDX41